MEKISFQMLGWQSEGFLRSQMLGGKKLKYIVLQWQTSFGMYLGH